MIDVDDLVASSVSLGLLPGSYAVAIGLVVNGLSTVAISSPLAGVGSGGVVIRPLVGGVQLAVEDDIVAGRVL
jgi:hypothetical protein